MASTTTQTQIINRALQILGYQSVSSINQNDRGAKAMLRAYLPVKLAMLRAYHWNFSIKRAIITASATAPIFGKAHYYQLPGDFLDLANEDQLYGLDGGGGPILAGPVRRDWQIEGQQIASDDPGPLQIRYVSSSITESQFDVLFAEAFSACLAVETCEELTQSNSKIANAEKIYDDIMKTAKQRNAFENKPVAPPVDTWITARF